MAGYQQDIRIHGKRRVIRLKPTIVTDAIGAGDVLLNSTEISNAVIRPGECSKLVNFFLIDYQDTANDLEIYLHQVGGIDIGTINAAPDISDDNLKLTKMLGVLDLDASDMVADLGGAKMIGHRNEDSLSANLPIFLQAEENSTSVYMSVKTMSTEQWTAANNLEFIFHIED